MRNLFMFLFLIIGYSLFSQSTVFKINQIGYKDTLSKISFYSMDWSLVFETYKESDEFKIESDFYTPTTYYLVADDNRSEFNLLYTTDDTITLYIYNNNARDVLFVDSHLNSQFQTAFDFKNRMNQNYSDWYVSLLRANSITAEARDSIVNIVRNKRKEISIIEKDYFENLPDNFIKLNYLYWECLKKEFTKDELQEFFDKLDVETLKQYSLYNEVMNMLKYEQLRIGMKLPPVSFKSESKGEVFLNDFTDKKTLFLYIWDPMCPFSRMLNEEIKKHVENDPSLVDHIVSVNIHPENDKGKVKQEFPWINLESDGTSGLELFMRLWSNRFPDGFIIENGEMKKMHCEFEDFYVFLKKTKN